MATYLILNGLVLAVVLAVTLRSLRRSNQKVLLAALAVLLVLTAIFDNLMIQTGIMVYSPEHISGLLIGVAPVEDFFYPIVAILLMPYLWRKLK